jgi:hypothetical protein
LSPDEDEDESVDDAEVEGVLLSVEVVDPDDSEEVLEQVVVDEVTVESQDVDDFESVPELVSGDSFSVSPTLTGDVPTLVFSFETTVVVDPEVEDVAPGVCTVVTGIGLLEFTEDTLTDAPVGLVATKYPQAARVATTQVAIALTISP